MEFTQECDGQWQDGKSTAVTAVRVKRMRDLVVMTFNDGRVLRENIAYAEFSSPMVGLPLRLTFKDGSLVTVPDGPVAKGLMHGRRSWAGLVESNFFKVAVPLLLGSVGVVWLLGAFVVPAISSYIGERLPTSVVNSLGDEYFYQIREKFTFDVDPEQKTLINELGDEVLEVVDANREFNYRFLVASNFERANAFALPNGHIVFTKETFPLLNEDELFAVLAHEVGHVELRHSAKALVNAGTWSFLATLVFNDYLFILTPVILASQSYSRANELEADCFAAQASHATGRDPGNIVSALAKLTDADENIPRDGNVILKEKIDELERERRRERGDPPETETSGEKDNDDDEPGGMANLLIELLSTHPSNETRESLLAKCDLSQFTAR